MHLEMAYSDLVGLWAFMKLLPGYRCRVFSRFSFIDCQTLPTFDADFSVNENFQFLIADIKSSIVPLAE